ncbi:MAG: DUF423 domain-containing protein [Bacteroidetes bacterium]|nr:DUF423 domain-containing protein [Bacteroidota bacterium]
MKQYRIIVTGAALAALAVAAGAFGAHGLKGKISPADLANFETAVRYQLIHALAIILLGAISNQLQNKLATWSFRAFWFGVICFSGSLYLLSTKTLSSLELAWLWPVTPLGGVSMILGWILLALAAYKSSNA